MSLQETSPLSRALQRFDGYSVRSGAAALALWPRNADRHVALSALVAAVASDGQLDAPCTRPLIRSRDWRRWLASRDSASIRSLQPAGTHDSPPVVHAVIAGKPWMLLGGALEHPAVHYGLWADAIETSLDDTYDTELNNALALLNIGALLSTRAANIAGLLAYPWPDHRLPLKLATPSDDEYERLLEAVSIPVRELTSARIDEEMIAPLLRGRGSPARWRPLALEQNGEVILIADPWKLTHSALIRACTHIARSTQCDCVVKHVRTAATRLSLNAAHDMDWPAELLDENTLLAQPDNDCRILLTTLVFSPDAGEEPVDVLHQPRMLTREARHAYKTARDLGATYSLLAVLNDGRPVTLSSRNSVVRIGRSSSQWAVGLGDLQLLGDSLRRDPLAIPLALERIPAPPWPENIHLVDLIGAIRRDESPPPERRNLPRDGTEHLHLRALTMSARQLAPHRNGTHWCEVTRWEGSQHQRIFRDANDDMLSLLVGGRGVAIWITPTDPSAGRFDLPGVLCVMLAHWVACLLEQGWLNAVEQLLLSIRIEVSDQQGPTLVVERRYPEIRMIAGPALVRQLCRGDNTADRTLVHGLLSVTAPDTIHLLDQILPEGHGTFVVWPSHDVYSNPPAFTPPPIVHSRDRLQVERELATGVLPADHIAILCDDDVRPHLKDLVGRLDLMIEACRSTLAPDSLVSLVELHQRAAAQTAAEEIATPARASITSADSLLGEREGLGPRDVALRALIERFSARPPNGNAAMSTRLTGWLRAATELQINMGATHDALSVGRPQATLAVSVDHGIACYLDGPINKAGRYRMEQLEREAPELMVREHADWWTTEPVTEEVPVLDAPIDLGQGAWTRVDHATKESWGISLEQLLRLLRTLSDIANETDTRVAVLAPSLLKDVLHKRTRINADVIAQGLLQLTLSPSSEFDAASGPFAAWRHNRERSYLRRPLVELPDGQLCFSAQHPLTCARYLIGLIDRGRLRGSTGLVKAVTQLSQEVDRAFEEAVLRCAVECGLLALSRITCIDGAPLQRANGDIIGDIDVLAWSQTTGHVWLLEVKRLAPGTEARTARREYNNLSRAAIRHTERIEWVRDNQDRLTSELGLDRPSDIRGALVIDRPLAGAYYNAVALPVITFSALPEYLEVCDLVQRIHD